jgi:hypothetical protein
MQRRFQFRLRALFAAMLVTAVLTHWFGDAIYDTLQRLASPAQHEHPVKRSPEAQARHDRYVRALYQVDVEEIEDVFIGFPPSYAEQQQSPDTGVHSVIPPGVTDVPR